jgi:hypothetical protein
VLLRHGLLKRSFVPSRAERELRELVRYRKSLVRERAAESNRVQKMLEGANIKLASVAARVLGRSGRAMVEALVAGVSEPRQLADLARGKLKAKQHELVLALRGVVGPINASSWPLSSATSTAWMRKSSSYPRRSPRACSGRTTRWRGCSRSLELGAAPPKSSWPRSAPI